MMRMSMREVKERSLIIFLLSIFLLVPRPLAPNPNPHTHSLSHSAVFYFFFVFVNVLDFKFFFLLIRSLWLERYDSVKRLSSTSPSTLKPVTLFIFLLCFAFYSFPSFLFYTVTASVCAGLGHAHTYAHVSGIVSYVSRVTLLLLLLLLCIPN